MQLVCRKEGNIIMISCDLEVSMKEILEFVKESLSNQNNISFEKAQDALSEYGSSLNWKWS